MGVGPCQEIIAAALIIAERVGVVGVTMRLLADELGVSVRDRLLPRQGQGRATAPDGRCRFGGGSLSAAATAVGPPSPGAFLGRSPDDRAPSRVSSPRSRESPKAPRSRDSANARSRCSETPGSSRKNSTRRRSPSPPTPGGDSCSTPSDRRPFRPKLGGRPRNENSPSVAGLRIRNQLRDPSRRDTEPWPRPAPTSARTSSPVAHLKERTGSPRDPCRAISRRTS